MRPAGTSIRTYGSTMAPMGFSPRRTVRRAMVAGALALALGMVGVSSAMAAEGTVWQVGSESSPTDLAPGGSGAYVLHVRNIGTATSDGSRITVVDRLPAGVEATASEGEFYEGATTEREYWECSGTTTVVCTNNPVGMPMIAPGPEKHAGSTAPLIVINVTVDSHAVEGSVQNLVTIAGGGGSEARSSTPMTISSVPARFGLASLEELSLNRDGSPDTQAGSHPYQLITNMAFNTVGGFEEIRLPEEVKDVEVSLPVGFVGNATAVPVCPRADFDYGRNGTASGLPACPADTQVGVDVASLFAPFLEWVLPVYNLQPPPGVPALFGFAYQYRVGFIDAGVRTGEGYGLKVTLHNLVQQQLSRNSLTLWGQPTDPSHEAEGGGGPAGPSPVPLLTNATSCGTPLASMVSMDSWEQPTEPLNPFSYPFTRSYPVTDNQGNQLSMQGCGKLEFNPTLEVKPETQATNTPTGLEVKLSVPQNPNPEGLATADLKDATVTLPAGMIVSPSVANGLVACTPAEIGIDNANTPACPDASRIGTVTGHTPLLGVPLTGSVYVAQQNENPFGSLLAIYLTAEADGALIKLAGHVQANPASGQLTVTFDENPQLPFSDLTVDLFGGPRAALVTPAACGTYAPSAQLSGWNGALVTPAIVPLQIDSGCAAPGFSPSFTAGTTGNAAGTYGTFSTVFSRPDGDQALGAISVRTPPGLLGMLSRVALCEAAQAAQGTCPAASSIGHVTAVAGPGPDPVTVAGGQVYLTGPYKGAPFGLSIVVPAVAGPFNLGNVIVRASISVDPGTAQVTIVSDPLPTILQGIPLDIRTIDVSVDRPGFMFNPTSCEPLATNATIVSDQGASAALSSRFQAADCASLAFTPKFTASTQGKTSKANGASLTVKVASSTGQANIARVDLQLPKVLPARLSTLQKACTEAQFAADPADCPAASVIGYARALTPVLGVPLVGPAYLVSHGGAAFPDVEFILQGEGVRIDLDGKTQIKKGITYSHFDTVPDAPISSFETVLPQGPHSVLANDIPAKAKGSLCGSSLTMPTAITAQNGAVLKQTTKIAVAGCPKTKKKTAGKKKQPRQRARRH